MAGAQGNVDIEGIVRLIQAIHDNWTDAGRAKKVATTNYEAMNMAYPDWHKSDNPAITQFMMKNLGAATGAKLPLETTYTGQDKSTAPVTMPSQGGDMNAQPQGNSMDMIKMLAGQSIAGQTPNVNAVPGRQLPTSAPVTGTQYVVPQGKQDVRNLALQKAWEQKPQDVADYFTGKTPGQDRLIDIEKVKQARQSKIENGVASFIDWNAKNPDASIGKFFQSNPEYRGIASEITDFSTKNGLIQKEDTPANKIAQKNTDLRGDEVELAKQRLELEKAKFAEAKRYKNEMLKFKVKVAQLTPLQKAQFNTGSEWIKSTPVANGGALRDDGNVDLDLSLELMNNLFQKVSKGNVGVKSKAPVQKKIISKNTFNKMLKMGVPRQEIMQKATIQ